LDDKRKELTQRLAQLKPAVDEHQRLEAALAALTSIGRGQSRATPANGRRSRPRAAKRPRRGKAATATAPSKPVLSGRRKGSGARGAEALALITKQPGITIPELGTAMGIKQNYLYRVLPKLAKESKVKKRGRGWHPA
jgi:hypothetical protein